MKSYDHYLNEAKMLARAGHYRSDVLKAFKTQYLLFDDNSNQRDVLALLISDIESNKLDELFN